MRTGLRATTQVSLLWAWAQLTTIQSYLTLLTVTMEISLVVDNIFLWDVVVAYDQLEKVPVCNSVVPQGASIWALITVVSPTHTFQGDTQSKRLESGTPLSRVGSYCYFQSKKNKLHLSLSTKAGAMLRQLLVFVVTHHSHCSPHWVVFRIATVICYLLSSFMMLCSSFLPFCMKPVYHFLSADHPSA